MLRKRLTRMAGALVAGAVLACGLTLWAAWNSYCANTARQEVEELRVAAQRWRLALEEQGAMLRDYLQDADYKRVQEIDRNQLQALEVLQRLRRVPDVVDAATFDTLQSGNAAHNAIVADLAELARRIHALVSQVNGSSERLDALLADARIPLEALHSPRSLHAVAKMDRQLARVMRALSADLRALGWQELGDTEGLLVGYEAWKAVYRQMARTEPERQWLHELDGEVAQLTENLHLLLGLTANKFDALERLDRTESDIESALLGSIGSRLEAESRNLLYQQRQAYLLVASCLFLLLCLVGASIASMMAVRRRLTTGLTPLMALARGISAGDLTSPVLTPLAQDEFRGVADAFLAMRNKMRDSLVSLRSVNTILDQFGGMRLHIDSSGTIGEVSSAASQALGYPADGLEGASMVLLFGQEVDFQTLRELIRQGLLQHQTWPWRCADGSSLPVQMSGLMIDDQRVVLLGRPAAPLEDGLLSKIGEGLVLLDGLGLIKQANPAAAAMLGIDDAFRMHRDLAGVLVRARCDRPFDAGLAAELARTGKGLELRLELQGVQPRVVHVSASTIAAATGQTELYALLLKDISELHRANEEVRRLAFVDPLTGLANRTRFAQCLDDAIKVARRRGGAFALLCLDLDGFKDVNDSQGHEQGDCLLQEVGRRLRREVREVDAVARLGGDEFCLLLGDAKEEPGATEVAQRCLDALAEPCVLAQASVNARCSIGIAMYPLHAQTAAGLLKAADTAMYAAKQAGKHRYAVFEEGMAQAVERRIALEASLRGAIERGEFELHYQPKVSLVSGAMQGVEALVRWRRPGSGLVPPDEFIGVAERIGMIGALGNWVLETACRQAVAWQAQGLEGLDMAVNISPSHFEQPGFVDGVARVVRACGVEPGALEIEVTESITRNPKRHSAICHALQQIGVRVAIDDFGTGYSSLSVLKHMQIDTLKLDRQFIGDMTSDASSAVMIGTIIGLAAGLKFSVVAEGVETLEQVQVLSGLGCPMAQGYYFSRPVVAEQIPALARTNFLARVATLPQMDLPAGPVRR